MDLRVVYPTPDVPGTELSFEEIWAANRGWLDRREWPDEAPDEAEVFVDEPIVDENAPHAVDVLAQRVKEKLVIHQDVQVDENGAPIHAKLVIHQDVVKLDENGAPIYPKSKPRKKKVAEVNETQISTSIRFDNLALTRQTHFEFQNPSGFQTWSRTDGQPLFDLH